METKINIAEVLQKKPKGTKLYSPICGVCTFRKLEKSDDGIEINVLSNDNETSVWRFYDNGKYNWLGEPLLFPSREMRDWRKFAWKKGDLLINSCGLQCIFKEWASDDYTEFNGCYSNSMDGYEDVSNAETAKFVKLDNNIAYGYVREIERKLGGKLNLETLEIEKAQPEFKDGDIVCISGMGYLAYGIVKSIDNSSKKLEYYVLNDMSTLKFEDWLSFEDKQIQPISETQQIILFDALAKEGKAWDAEKKLIVDLKPKCEFKPFDKVLCRNSKDDTWEADFIARLTRKEIDYTQSGKYLCVGDLWMYCIPYNEETAHLLGTTDEWEGGNHD